jgi:hypothetical protein
MTLLRSQAESPVALANSINTGCGAATALNVGFEVLNQSLTEKQFKTANGIHPFAFNRMVHGNIIPTHAIWMEYPKQR